MKECLSPTVLEELSERRFRGNGLFEILKHLETCEKCRSQIRLPTKEEILKRFEADEPPPMPNSAKQGVISNES